MPKLGLAAASSKVFGGFIRQMQVPDAPLFFSQGPRDGEIDLYFRRAYDGGTSINNYQYAIDDGIGLGNFGPWVTVGDFDASHISSNMRGITITGLTNGVKYAFKLRAVNNVGPGASFQSDFITGTFPSAPTITNIENRNEELKVNFTAPSSNGGRPIINYDYSLDNGSTWVTRNPASTVSPIVITGLTNNTSYQIKIRARNDHVGFVGPGTPSDASTGTPSLGTAPSAPTINTIVPGDQQLSVIFSAGSDGGSTITNYEYSTDDGSTWTTRSPAAVSSPVLITGLTNDTTYQIKLRAVNSVGAGTASTASSGTPIAPGGGGGANILNFGSVSYNLQLDALQSGPAPTQTLTALNLNGTYQLGDFIYNDGSASPLDLTGYSSFGLRCSLAGVNPNATLIIGLYDLGFNGKAYEIQTSALSTSPVVLPMTYVYGESDLSQIGYVAIEPQDEALTINLTVYDLVGYL